VKWNDKCGSVFGFLSFSFLLKYKLDVINMVIILSVLHI
jgi:hypothetical protein